MNYFIDSMYLSLPTINEHFSIYNAFSHIHNITYYDVDPLYFFSRNYIMFLGYVVAKYPQYFISLTNSSSISQNLQTIMTEEYYNMSKETRSILLSHDYKNLKYYKRYETSFISHWIKSNYSDFEDYTILGKSICYYISKLFNTYLKSFRELEAKINEYSKIHYNSYTQIILEVNKLKQAQCEKRLGQRILVENEINIDNQRMTAFLNSNDNSLFNEMNN